LVAGWIGVFTMPQEEMAVCSIILCIYLGFAGYISEHGGGVPRWVAAAFWWLSHAVDGSFSAEDLSAAITR
jgi:hypothetical protein